MLSQSGKYCCLTWLSGKLLPNQSDCCEHMNRAMAPSRSAAWWLHRDCQQLLTADCDKKKMDQSLIDDSFFIHKHQHGTSHWQFMVECGCSEGHLYHLWITNTAFMCASLHFTNLSFFVHTIFGFCSHVHLLQGSYTLFDEWEPWIIWHVVVCLPTVHWKIFFGHAKRIVTHYSSYLKKSAPHNFIKVFDCTSVITISMFENASLIGPLLEVESTSICPINKLQFLL